MEFMIYEFMIFFKFTKMMDVRGEVFKMDEFVMIYEVLSD